MKAAERETGVLDLLAEHERLMGRLYKVYSEMFLEHQGFWLGLAAEELMHAARIEDLAGMPDGAVFIQDALDPRAVNSSIEYVARRAREAEVHDLDLLTALSVARDIELAMIEHRWFETLETNTHEARQVLAEIAADTRRHSQMITAMWESERGRRTRS